jgi:hypothetical protein
MAKPANRARKIHSWTFAGKGYTVRFCVNCGMEKVIVPVWK